MVAIHSRLSLRPESLAALDLYPCPSDDLRIRSRLPLRYPFAFSRERWSIYWWRLKELLLAVMKDHSTFQSPSTSMLSLWVVGIASQGSRSCPSRNSLWWFVSLRNPAVYYRFYTCSQYCLWSWHVLFGTRQVSAWSFASHRPWLGTFRLLGHTLGSKDKGIKIKNVTYDNLLSDFVHLG